MTGLVNKMLFYLLFAIWNLTLAMARGKLCSYSDLWVYKKVFETIIFSLLNCVFFWTNKMFVMGSRNNTLAKFVNAEWSWKMAVSERSSLEFFILETE